MADWSELPKDLLIQIADSLHAPIDYLRVRSVCSTWRTYVSPKPRGLPNRFPILPKDGIPRTDWGLHLSKRTIYRISIPPVDSDSESESLSSSSKGCDWIVKIEEDEPGRMHLLHPLSEVRFKPLPSDFVRNLDMLKFRVSELGQEYVMHYIDFSLSASSFGGAYTVETEKVVFCQDENPKYSVTGGGGGGVGCKVLAKHLPWGLHMFASVDNKWKVIKEPRVGYDDVKLYRGKFYAVDRSGRTVMVESDSKIELVAEAESVLGGQKKYLVESRGCLLLVDMYLLDMSVEDVDEPFYLGFRLKIVGIKVYKLAEKEKKWVEMESLGDEILFLGENCVFSVSTADISGYEGNCIYIMKRLNGCYDRTGKLREADFQVYHFNSNCIETLTSKSEDFKLFWPPPSWIPTTMGVDSQMEDKSL